MASQSYYEMKRRQRAQQRNEQAPVVQPAQPAQPTQSVPVKVQEDKIAVNEQPVQEDVVSESVVNEPNTVSVATVHKKEEKVQKKPKAKASVKKKPAVTNPGKSHKVTQIPNFPDDLYCVAKSMFPTARTKADAITAYILATVHPRPDVYVSESVQELLREYDGYNPMATMSDQLQLLTKQMGGTAVVMQELELALSFLIFDRLGFRKADMPDARSVEFLESASIDVLLRLREQTKQYLTQEAIKNGRPIR